MLAINVFFRCCWLQQFYMDLCGTLNDILNLTLANSMSLKWWKNYYNLLWILKALKIGNEINGAVLCGWTGGSRCCSCQKHSTAEECRGKVGLGEEGLHKTFVWVEITFFQHPCWLFMQTRSNKVEIWLHTDISFNPFWNVQHILTNSLDYKLDMTFKIKLERERKNCHERLKFDKLCEIEVLSCWLKECISANSASEPLYQRNPKRGINGWEICH